MVTTYSSKDEADLVVALGSVNFLGLVFRSTGSCYYAGNTAAIQHWAACALHKWSWL